MCVCVCVVCVCVGVYVCVCVCVCLCVCVCVCVWVGGFIFFSRGLEGSICPTLDQLPVPSVLGAVWSTTGQGHWRLARRSFSNACMGVAAHERTRLRRYGCIDSGQRPRHV
jgi:hypothetical protein